MTRRGKRYGWSTLLVLLMAAPAATSYELCPLGRFPMGGNVAVASNGSIAVAGVGTALLTFDISMPDSPVALGMADVPDLARDIVIRDSLAFVAAGSAGLRVVDFSSPDAPVEIGAAPTPDDALNLALDGSRAYVAAWEGGLRVFDVSDPTSPYETDSVDLPDDNSQDVAVMDGRIFVADYFRGLRVLEYGPFGPVELGTLPNSGGQTTQSVAATGSYVYVGTGALIGHSGLRVVDASRPSAPVEIGSLFAYDDVLDVLISGSNAYLATRQDLSIVDVTDPTAPTSRGSFATPQPTQQVVLVDQVALIASGTAFRAIDVSDIDAPHEVFSYPTLGSSRQIAMTRNLGVLTDINGAWILDVTDPSSPLPLSHIAIPNGGESVVVRDQHAFVTGIQAPYRGVHVINLSVPSEPAYVSFSQVDYRIEDVDHSGSFLYLTGGTTAIHVVDVSDPGQLVPVANIPHQRGGKTITVRNGTAYVLTNTDFLTFDVTEPSAPVQLGSLDLPFQGHDFVLAGDYAYAVHNGGIFVIDVSDPTGPFIAGSAAAADWPDEIAIDRNTLFTAGAFGVMHIFDITNPTSPLEIGSVTVDDPVASLEVWNGLVFAPMGDAGLYVFSSCDLVFRDDFESGGSSRWTTVGR